MRQPQNLPEIWVLDQDDEFLPSYGDLLSVRYKLAVFDTHLRMSSHESCPALVIINSTGPDLPSINSEVWRHKVLVIIPDGDLDVAQSLNQRGVLSIVLKPVRIINLLLEVERLTCITPLPNRIDGILIPGLTWKERLLLAKLLIDARDVSRSELIDAVWNKTAVGKKTFDVHLFNLRHKLKRYGYEILFKEQSYCLRQTSAHDKVAGL